MQQQAEFKLKQGCNDTAVTSEIKRSNNNNTCNPIPTNKSKQLIVTAYVSNKPFNMFLDTGAGASLISTRIIHQLNMLDQIKPTATIIKGLSNMKLLTKGEIHLKITVAKTEVKQKFIVMDNLPDDILAGTNLMEQLDMHIDVAKQTIQTRYGKIQARNYPTNLPQQCKIKVKKRLTIPANSVTHFVAKLSMRNSDKTHEGIVFNNPKLTHSFGICIQNSMTHSTGNEIPIRCVNPLPRDITLYKHRVIGTMVPVDQAYRQTVKKLDSYNAETNIPRLPEAEPEEITKHKDKWENMDKLFEQLGVNELQIDEHHKKELKELLKNYSHCFSKHQFDLGTATFFEASLKLKHDYVAKWIPTRQVPYNLEHVMEKELMTLVQGVS